VRILALLAGLVLFAAPVQETTTLAFYLVPKIGAGTFFDTFRPKYIGDFGTARDPMTPQAVARPQWAGMDLGIEPTFLVGANLTAAQHTFVQSQGDVMVIPALDTVVGGNPTLNQTRNALEQRNIPANITAATTWRQVVGIVGRNCLILQRLNGLHKTRLFPAGVSLDSQPNQAVLDQLVSVGQSFGMNVSGLSIALTVRENLLLMTAQMGAFSLMGEAF
jgi:hypothetical protein